MGDKRSSNDINLGALYGVPRPETDGLPRPDPQRGPVFVSHEETLRRYLDIINARTVAELGPLPPGGLPVQPKRKPDEPYRPLPASANHETTEDEAMKWSQIAAATAMAAGLAACEPSPKTGAVDESTQTRSAAQKNNIPPPSSTESEEVSTVELRSSYVQCLNAAGGATWSMQDCIEKEWDYQDARLNAAYQKLKAKLPKTQWEQLHAEQREWLINRDHNEVCKWDEATEGQAQRIAANECTLRQVAGRADKLEKLLATKLRRHSN